MAHTGPFNGTAVYKGPIVKLHICSVMLASYAGA